MDEKKLPRAFYVGLGALLVVPLALAFAIRSPSSAGRVVAWVLVVVLVVAGYLALRRGGGLGLLAADDRGERPST